MCGRYTLTTGNPQQLAARFGLATVPPGLAPQYNIAPSQLAPVILNDSPTALHMAQWGLIPRWADDAAIGQRMINARAETLAAKPSFREPLRRQRCLVVADGFYEWRQTGRRKTPFRITMPDGALFAMAGLWDQWVDPASQHPVTTFTIITTPPNPSMAPLHDRMPAILPQHAEPTWLSPSLEVGSAMALLRPYDGALRTYEVSSLVNSPQVNVEDVIRPVR